jgi:hypothetical protein
MWPGRAPGRAAQRQSPALTPGRGAAGLPSLHAQAAPTRRRPASRLGREICKAAGVVVGIKDRGSVRIMDGLPSDQERRRRRGGLACAPLKLPLRRPLRYRQQRSPRRCLRSPLGRATPGQERDSLPQGTVELLAAGLPAAGRRERYAVSVAQLGGRHSDTSAHVDAGYELVPRAITSNRKLSARIILFT